MVPPLEVADSREDVLPNLLQTTPAAIVPFAVLAELVQQDMLLLKFMITVYQEISLHHY